MVAGGTAKSRRPGLEKQAQAGRLDFSNAPFFRVVAVTVGMKGGGSLACCTAGICMPAMLKVGRSSEVESIIAELSANRMA